MRKGGQFYARAGLVDEANPDRRSLALRRHAELGRVVPERFWPSEPRENSDVERFCDEYRGRLVNADIFRCMRSLYFMQVFGVLDYLQGKDRPILMEIGAGCGSFALSLH